MKIVSFKICPFVQRVIAVLELKEVAYDVEYISLADKPGWFTAVSPHGQVPILIENAGALFESGPIAEYIDEVYGTFRLHPSDPFVKARHRAWIELASVNYLVQCGAQRSSTAADLEANAAKLSMVFAKIEDVLGESIFFAGPKPSMVDAAWFILLHRAHIIEQCTGFDFLAEFPKTKRWQSASLAEDALMRSAPEGFVEEFMNFYLNENTYLGSLMKLGKGQCGATEKAECDSDTVTACCR